MMGTWAFLFSEEKEKEKELDSGMEEYHMSR